MKYTNVSYGCQMNVHESEKIAGILEELGYTPAGSIEESDIIVFNTCCIRDTAEKRAFGNIGAVKPIKKKNKDLIVAVVGCMTEQKGYDKIFKEKYPYVDIVLGTGNLNLLKEKIIEKREQGKKTYLTQSCNDPIDETVPQSRTSYPNAWVNIMYGCNNFCTYCIVPYTRGRERSRASETIIKEAKDALAQGFKEITLLGQNVDSYGKDFKDREYRLADLLTELNALDGDFWIRFVTSYPTDITDNLIDTAVKLDKVCEYFHIPMQSGSSEVLKKMNRRYNREEYTQIATKIREMVPDVTITSDFIAGFPGETEEQFQETLTAMEELNLDYSNTAAYSPREKTVAAKWVDKFIPEEIKTERLKRLNDKNKECCLKSNKKYIGRELDVLIENFENHKGKNVITGRTRNNKIVHIPYDKDLTGEFVKVKITGAKTWYINGELIKK